MNTQRNEGKKNFENKNNKKLYMYSYKHFTPGNKSLGSTKLIQYQTLKNDTVVCGCYRRVSKKFVDRAPNQNVSRAVRIANIVRSTVGGKTHFGNYYFTEPVFNYLGKVEGQPGGSGAPVRNRY